MDNLEVVKLLARSPTEAQLVSDREKITALKVARKNGSTKCVEFLEYFESQDERCAEAEQILSEKSVKDSQFLVYILGNAGTGKTTLARALQGKKFIKAHNSTEAIEITHAELTRGVGSANPRSAAQSLLKSGSQLGVLAHFLKPHLQPRVASQQYQLVTMAASTIGSALRIGRDVVTGLIHASPDSDEGTTKFPPELSSIQESRVQADLQLHELRQSNGQATEGPYVFIWDVGGHMPMLMEASLCVHLRRSIYIVTLDATKDLESQVKENIFRYGSTENGNDTYKLPCPVPGLTEFDYLKMVLSLISLKRTTGTASSRHGQKPTNVMIVVTHIDKVDQDVVERKKMFETAVEKLSAAMTGIVRILGPLFVDNRRVQDQASCHSQMQKVQQELKSLMTPADDDDDDD
eukprot:scpid66826/ scgid20592/ 